MKNPVAWNATCRSSRRTRRKVWSARELRKRIDRALAQLSEEHRNVLVLHEFEELEYKEIAKRMDCSIGTVMSRLFYARRRMASLLVGLKRENSRMNNELGIEDPVLARWRIVRCRGQTQVAAQVTSDTALSGVATELRQTKSALAGNEMDLKVPETREFYWSKIARQIRTRRTQVGGPQCVRTFMVQLPQVFHAAGRSGGGCGRRSFDA